MEHEERRSIPDRRGEDPKWNATKEVGGFLAAEVLSIGVSVGAFTFIDEIAPHTVDKVSRVIAKTCVEPYLETIEKGMRSICHSKDCQVDPRKPREERALAYARYLTRFGASFAVGIISEPLIRTGLNKWWKVKNPASNVRVLSLDKTVHLGALAIVNTIGAKQTDAVIDTTSSILQKTLGWSPERSKKAADGTIRWEASNLFSAVVTSFYMIMRQLGAHGKISH